MNHSTATAIPTGEFEEPDQYPAAAKPALPVRYWVRGDLARIGEAAIE